MLTIIKTIIILVVSILLVSCGHPSLSDISKLQQGQRYFNSSLYKSAMEILLPLAVDGNTQAQYAVGYMYYYGYGVSQDINTGFFWIKRSAEGNFGPAKEALILIKKQSNSLVTGIQHKNNND